MAPAVVVALTAHVHVVSRTFNIIIIVLQLGIGIKRCVGWGSRYTNTLIFIVVIRVKVKKTSADRVTIGAAVVRPARFAMSLEEKPITNV